MVVGPASNLYDLSLTATPPSGWQKGILSPFCFPRTSGSQRRARAWGLPRGPRLLQRCVPWAARSGGGLVLGGSCAMQRLLVARLGVQPHLNWALVQPHPYAMLALVASQAGRAPSWVLSQTRRHAKLPAVCSGEPLPSSPHSLCSAGLCTVQA